MPKGVSNCSAAGISRWAPHAGACSGLRLDALARDAQSCASHCCSDAKCVLWQMEADNTCASTVLLVLFVPRLLSLIPRGGDTKIVLSLAWLIMRV